MERLDRHFEKLTKASFARYGFAYGELMGHWPEIVGKHWPGTANRSESDGPGAGEMAQKLGGTLVIRAEPGRGLDLQYQSHQIIERISVLRLWAVTSVKVMQGQVSTRKPLKNKDITLDSKSEASLKRGSIDADEKLKKALHRLGAEPWQTARVLHTTNNIGSNPQLLSTVNSMIKLNRRHVIFGSVALASLALGAAVICPGPDRPQ